MNEIDRKAAREIRLALEENLTTWPLMEELGLVPRVKNGRYDATFVEFKVEFAIVDEATGIEMTREAQDYNMLCTSYGLEPEWLGMCYTSGNKEMRIIGLKPRATKFPILTEDTKTGKRYKNKAGVVANAMRIAIAEA
jgi:hypothetical protein